MYAMVPCAMEFYSSPLDSLGLNSSAMDSCAIDSSALNSFAMDSSAIFYTTSQVLIVYCYDSYKQNPNECNNNNNILCMMTSKGLLVVYRPYTINAGSTAGVWVVIQ